MLSSWKLVCVSVAAVVLVACGGGSSNPTPKGAIAINASTGYGAIAIDFTSQAEANSRALGECGTGCEVALTFSGDGECGSIARGGNAVWGVSSAGSKEKADQGAYNACVAKGGTGCVIPYWLSAQGQCN